MISSSQRRTNRFARAAMAVAALLDRKRLRQPCPSRGNVALLSLTLMLLLSAASLSATPPPTAAPQAVFVVSSGNQISEYTTTGVLVRTLSGGPLGSFRGLAFGADGYLYVTNTFTCGSDSCNELEKFDPNTGLYLGAVGSITPTTNPFSGVTNLATSSNGLALGPGNDLYLTTNQFGLYKIDPVANTTVPIATADCCTNGVAFLPDGTPLAVGNGQNAVKNDLTGAAFNTGFFTSAQAIAFGPSGRLYVLQGTEIDTVPATGGAFTRLTAANATSVGFFLTLDAQGNIWVTDANYGVREFSSATGAQIGGFTSNVASGFAGIAIGSIKNGNVWAWGDNGFGELGNGTTTNSGTPVQVSNLSSVVAIADGCCDTEFGLALKSDGTVWGWGYNGPNGQLGIGIASAAQVTRPVQVSGLTGMIAIAANWDHSLAVKSDGTVWAWGSNNSGESGNGTITNSLTPVQVSNLSGVIAVAAGDSCSFALKSDGTVWAWGDNSTGQLGTGTTSGTRVTTPVQVTGLSGVVAIAAGSGSSLVLKSDGTVWGWGYNLDGRLGNGTITTSYTPVQASGLSGVIAIAAGQSHSLALKNDGTIWAWGTNGSGELGNGTTVGSTIPVQVPNLSGMSAIAGGYKYSFGLKSDGTVWAWGINIISGQLGIGTTSLGPVTVPVQVPNLSGVTAIAAGDMFSLAIQGQTNGTATHFGVSAPASVTAGTGFNVTVTALDASNATATGYAGTVLLSSSDGSAVLPTAYTFTAADGGTHTFSTTLSTAGSQTVTSTDTANSGITGTSGSITVGAGFATHFAVSASASVTAGTPFSVTVLAQDGSNNNVTTYVGTVHFTSTDGGATLPSDYTFTAADNGAHVFSATLNTTGNQTITATDKVTASITGTSNATNVTSPLPPRAQIVVNETITVSDAESFPDVFDAETLQVTDSVFVTPIIAVAAPVAEFSAGRLGFSGQSGSQIITVSNIGQAPVTLSSVGISGSSQFAITHITCTNGSNSLSVTLPMGGACTFTINYTASANPGSDNATVVFTDNAALSNLPTAASGPSYTQSVPLSGAGATIGPPSPPPATVQVLVNEPIRVTDTQAFPDVLDAEAVRITDVVFITPIIKVGAPVVSFSAGALGFHAQSGTQVITASAIGQAPLTLASVTISGSAQFAITQIPCSNGATSLPATLPVGGVCTFTINYTASATPANDNATLVFTDNAALSNLLTTSSGSSYMQSVPLTGSGTIIGPPPPPPATVQVLDNETVHVMDAESFPDIFDSEAIKVTDAVSITIYNTSVGNVTVTPVDTTTGQSPVTVTFSNVAVPGNTTLATSSAGPAPTNGFQLGTPPVYYNLATTASYTGTITICINYAGISFPNGAPSLWHYSNGAWSNITTSVNTGTMVVCGVTASLSPFALFQPVAVPTTTSLAAPGVTYGTAPSVTVSVGASSGTASGNVTLSVDGGAAIPGTLSNGSATFNLGILGAGIHSLSANFAAQGSFLASSVAGALAVTPASLTISASSGSRPYGANNPVLPPPLVAGIQNGDAIGSSYSIAATPASPIGSYPVVPAPVGASNVLSNYNISLVNGTLSVLPESTSLNITFTPVSIMVGQSTVATITLTAPDMVIPIDPSALANFTLTSPVASDILSNNGVCTPVPSSPPGLASCVITVTSVEPNGRTLLANFPGSTDLAASNSASSNTGNLIVTAALQSQQVCIASDFRNVAVPGGSTVWFNSIFKLRDVTKQLVHISFYKSTVQFQYTDASNTVNTVNLALPDAHITMDPSATMSTTTFDAVNNVWNTTLPWYLDDNSFLTGMSWVVPSAGLPADVEPVTMCGTFASDVPNIDIGWRWAAAAYSSFGSDNTTLGVKPMDTDNDNPPKNFDRAGTPENYKTYVIPGARGKGGKNYTGSYSRSAIIE